jgi:hypothetical protein
MQWKAEDKIFQAVEKTLTARDGQQRQQQQGHLILSCITLARWLDDDYHARVYKATVSSRR